MAVIWLFVTVRYYSLLSVQTLYFVYVQQDCVCEYNAYMYYTSIMNICLANGCKHCRHQHGKERKFNFSYSLEADCLGLARTTITTEK